MIYYCGLNQFIVQRNLAAKTLRDGQLGMIFAGAPLAAGPLRHRHARHHGQPALRRRARRHPDAAFPTLIRELIPPGIRGFIFAAIAGAVTSTLASLLNSASTIATMDVYKRPHQPDGHARSNWSGSAAS